MDHVKLSPTRRTLLAAGVKRREVFGESREGLVLYPTKNPLVRRTLAPCSHFLACGWHHRITSFICRNQREGCDRQRPFERSGSPSAFVPVLADSASGSPAGSRGVIRGPGHPCRREVGPRGSVPSQRAVEQAGFQAGTLLCNCFVFIEFVGFCLHCESGKQHASQIPIHPFRFPPL